MFKTVKKNYKAVVSRCPPLKYLPRIRWKVKKAPHDFPEGKYAFFPFCLTYVVDLFFDINGRFTWENSL